MRKSVKCPLCGAYCDASQKFCERCGALLSVCANCGAPLADTMQFCPVCGAPKKLQKVRKPVKKRNIAIAAVCGALVLLAVLVGGSIILLEDDLDAGRSASDEQQTGTAQTAHFATPEDTIEYLTEQLRSENMEGALETFAIDEMMAGYSCEAYTERLAALVPTSTKPPVEYAVYRELVRTAFRYEAAMEIANLIYSLCDLPESFLDHEMVALGDLYTAQEVVEMFNPQKLPDLQLVGISYIRPETQDSELGQENCQKLCATYGADDRQEYLAVFQTEEEYYIGGVTLWQYGDEWKIEQLYSVLGGQGPNAGLTSVTQAQAEEALQIGDFDFGS